MTLSAIAPLTPINPAWEGMYFESQTGYPALAFYHRRLKLYVISAVEVVDAKIGPEYHVTVSKQTLKGARRCTSAEAALVVLQFGAEAAQEDNHSNVIRSYWMPVDQSLRGYECACKDSEAVIRDGDFEWRPLTQANADRAERINAHTK